MNEDALVRAILERIARPTASGVRVGPGDDAAVVSVGDGADLVATTDALVEGVHFLPDARAEDVGWKLVESNLSDLAAMGATPRWLLVAVVVADGRGETALAVVDAAAARCDARGVAVVGGNVSSGPGLSFTTTALGEIRGAPLLRSGAKAGDAIWLTGPTGLAAIDRSHRAVARIEEGRRASGFAHAAIDVSDGLALDLSRLCRASGVGATLRLGDVPRAREVAAAARARGLDPDETIAAGGEDYELLIAAPADARPEGLTRVGEIVEAPALDIRRLDGTPYDGPHGWIHGDTLPPRKSS